jgi:hypothetical protein
MTDAKIETKSFSSSSCRVPTFEHSDNKTGTRSKPGMRLDPALFFDHVRPGGQGTLVPKMKMQDAACFLDA